MQLCSYAANGDNYIQASSQGDITWKSGSGPIWFISCCSKYGPCLSTAMIICPVIHVLQMSPSIAHDDASQHDLQAKPAGFAKFDGNLVTKIAWVFRVMAYRV